ncbi:MAG: calcium-binding protein [Rhodospirillales bacterium]|nr:calcium-binding protein [Rhodospirillales bacterium]
MATFTGTSQRDTITSLSLSRGVVADPPGALPSDAVDRISGLGGNDSIDGAGGADTISGGDGADTITGDGTIAGDGGNDVLRTIGAVDTTARGGAGNDAIEGYSDAATLRLYGDDGDDRLGVSSDSGSPTTFLYGGSGNDSLKAASDFNNASFGVGRNTLAGGTGDDRYIVFQSSDVVTEAADSGFDTVESWADFTLPENVESLTLLSTGYFAYGNELATGNGRANVIRGNTENNRIDGLGGDDTLYGRARGMDPADIYGDAYADADTLRGGDGNDRLFGGDGVAATWDGNDSLYGEGGADSLVGGRGADTLSGGPGGDTYRYAGVGDSPASGPDRILNFDGVGPAAGDKIDLTAVDGNATAGGRQAFSFVSGSLTKAGQLHVVDARGTSSTIEGEVDGKPGADFVVAVDDGAAKASDWVAGDFFL